MTELSFLVARLIALVSGRSLPIRKTALLSRTQTNLIGIAPIRVAGDDRLQAVAFGPLGSPPTVVTLPDPYSPIQPGLDWVGQFLVMHVVNPSGCQIWVPDTTSLACLALEGQRSRRNPKLTSARQLLGICCHALDRISQLPGQQVVAVATTVLATHLATGQSPEEDPHLAARLAWDDPAPGSIPAQVAAEGRLLPGPSLLLVREDERIEQLRGGVLKGTAGPGELLEIEQILTQAAKQAWVLLEHAHRVYSGLPLLPLPGIDELEAASYRELAWLLRFNPAFGIHLGATRAEFQKREFWRARLENLEARGDAVVRELLRLEGRVVAATTLRVWAPKKRGQGWRILIRTSQKLLRIRRGTRLSTADGRVEATVEAMRGQSGSRLLLLRVTKGKKSATALTGTVADWCDTVVFQGRSESGPTPRLDTIPLPNPVSQIPVTGNLLRTAMRLRQP
jgi:hypothetical protein